MSTATEVKNKMKLAEYAAARGLEIDAVKAALEATGQTTHPTHYHDADLLDSYFAKQKQADGLPTAEDLALAAEQKSAQAEADKAVDEASQALANAQAQAQATPDVLAEAERAQAAMRAHEQATAEATAKADAAKAKAAEALAKSVAPGWTGPVLGEPGQGKKVFKLVAKSSAKLGLSSEFRAWGYDESTAIAAVVASRHDYKTNASMINWTVTPV